MWQRIFIKELRSHLYPVQPTKDGFNTSEWKVIETKKKKKSLRIKISIQYLIYFWQEKKTFEMKMRQLCPKYDKLYAQGNSVAKTLVPLSITRLRGVEMICTLWTESVLICSNPGPNMTIDIFIFILPVPRPRDICRGN